MVHWIVVGVEFAISSFATSVVGMASTCASTKNLYRLNPQVGTARHVWKAGLGHNSYYISDHCICSGIEFTKHLYNRGGDNISMLDCTLDNCPNNALRQCIHGHKGYMKLYNLWDVRYNKYMPRWRCLECNRIRSRHRPVQRRFVMHVLYTYQTEPPY